MMMLENEKWLLVVEGEKVKVTNKRFNDSYYGTLSEGNFSARNGLDLAQIIKAKNELGFK